MSKSKSDPRRRAINPHFGSATTYRIAIPFSVQEIAVRAVKLVKSSKSDPPNHTRERGIEVFSAV